MELAQTISPASVLTNLLNLPKYRQMWEQYVQRKRGNSINIRAVANFLAFELSDEAGYELSAEKLKDSVRRALNGELITDRTANRFIMGFGFTTTEARQLWNAMVNQRKQIIMVDGEAPRQSKTTADYAPYRTLEQVVQISCDEYGLTQSLDITNSFVIEEDNVEYVKPVIESSELDIEILEGGVLTRISDQATGLYDKFSSTAHSLVIKLPYVMHKNEIHRLRMRVSVNETHDDLDPDVPLNYFLTGSVDKPCFNLTTIVNFSKAPKYLSSAIWDDGFNNPIYEEVMDQGTHHASSHCPMALKSFIGFRWSIRSEKN